MFPIRYFSSLNIPRQQANQAANFVVVCPQRAQEIDNIYPNVLVSKMVNDSLEGKKKFGDKCTIDDMLEMLDNHAIPSELQDSTNLMSYDDFLRIRRSKMSQQVKEWFELL
jgi:hypothetical protein